MKKGVDFIGIGAGAVILNGDGKVFLALRGREARNESGKWEFPGGCVEFEIEVVELLDVVNHIIPAEKQHWVSPTFLCRYKGGTAVIKEPHKCDKIGWFRLDEIPEQQLTIASKKSLESLRKIRVHRAGKQ